MHKYGFYICLQCLWLTVTIILSSVLNTVYMYRLFALKLLKFDHSLGVLKNLLKNLKYTNHK